MEDDNNKWMGLGPTDILKLSDKQKAERLWFLFNQKILDLFINQCQQLQNKGVNLRELGALKQKSKDLKFEYQSMKRAYVLTMEDIEIAKSEGSGWKSIKSDEEGTVSIKPDKSMLSIRASGVADFSFKHLCYAIYLIKHHTQCLPFCKQAKDILEHSIAQKIAFLGLSFPVPLIKDRCCLIRGLGFRNSEKLSNIYIFVEGLNSRKQYLQKVKVDALEYMKGKQLFDLKHCAMQIRYIKPELFQYSLIAILDHHIPVAPEAILVFVVKQFIKFLVNNLINKLRNFEESVWGKQRKENFKQNQSFYQWIDEIAQSFKYEK